MAWTAASFVKTYDALPQLAGNGDMVEMELGVRQARKIVAASLCCSSCCDLGLPRSLRRDRCV